MARHDAAGAPSGETATRRARRPRSEVAPPATPTWPRTSCEQPRFAKRAQDDVFERVVGASLHERQPVAPAEGREALGVRLPGIVVRPGEPGRHVEIEVL